MPLLDDSALQVSSVVANCDMNRERRLSGSNGYERDLGLKLIPFLMDVPTRAERRWVDLCCGTGRALIDAAAELRKSPQADVVRIEGVDLIGDFDPNPWPQMLALTTSSLETWQPVGPYRLATCVHGLHYIGDKLRVITKAVRRLAPKGLFIANLDLANFRFADGKPAGRAIAARLRRHGMKYDTRRRLISCLGPRDADLGARYLGADDAAGPNYTGQSAVDSYYDFDDSL